MNEVVRAYAVSRDPKGAEMVRTYDQLFCKNDYNSCVNLKYKKVLAGYLIIIVLLLFNHCLIIV